MKLTAIIVALPSLALAHPGHGTTEPTSWAHYLTEPIHAVSLATALAAGWVLRGWTKRVAERQRRAP